MNNTATPPPPLFALNGPIVPAPLNHAANGITLFVLAINLIAAIALCIARRSFVLVTLPFLKADDIRRRGWLQLLVINILVLYCCTNLISAVFGTAAYAAMTAGQMMTFVYLNAVEVGFYYLCACVSFILIGGLILLWLNIAFIWFSMYEERSKASKICFWTVVGSLLFFIGVGVVTTLFISALTFFAPLHPAIATLNNTYTTIQFPITIAVSIIILLYGVVIGIRVIIIMKEGVGKDDNQGPLLKKRNIMIRKVLLVLAGDAISLLVRFGGIIVSMNYFNMYYILQLLMRAIPDAAVTWSFVVLFWPYASAKIVSIDAPNSNEIKKQPPQRTQEMEQIESSPSPSVNNEAEAV